MEFLYRVRFQEYFHQHSRIVQVDLDLALGRNQEFQFDFNQARPQPYLEKNETNYPRTLTS